MPGEPHREQLIAGALENLADQLDDESHDLWLRVGRRLLASQHRERERMPVPVTYPAQRMTGAERVE